jgi:hypothetical protein
MWGEGVLEEEQGLWALIEAKRCWVLSGNILGVVSGANSNKEEEEEEEEDLEGVGVYFCQCENIGAA